MAIFVTPVFLQRQSEFYHQLASMTGAGIGLPRALDQLSKHTGGGGFRRSLALIIDRIERGNTFAGALQESGRDVPAFDLALLQAGEQSGRLDACFRLLSEYYRERAQLARQVMAGLAYPVLLVHFFLLIFPLGMLQGLVLRAEILPFLTQKLLVLGPIYGGVIVLLISGQGRWGERWRSLVETVLHRVPVLGRARRNIALSRLSIALEALVNAGVRLVQAWELAAAASGSPALRRAVIGWRPRLEAGQTPAELVSASPEFPETFASLYTTGEVTGQIDDTLRRLHHYYQEEGSRRMKTLAVWVPILIYLGVVIMIAYQVIKFWS
ncbi:MAG TPA: type II secretion system F family protein, partial [Methylomirabilota bacterium]|nr:type II secretion system F family protein [Methylomirabilota bacterium]